MTDAPTTPTTPPPATPPSPAPTTPDQFEFEFHPLAEKFPLIEGDDLVKLASDIRANGLIEQITLYQGKILDGRNRYRAMKAGKLAFVRTHFRELLCHLDPVAYVISANIHRRHLTAEQKRALLAELIKRDPSKSNRAIAAEAKVDDKTVGAVRQELEATAEIPQLTATTGKDGKTRRTKGTGKEKKKPAHERYRTLQEQMIDVLQEFTSIDHAKEYVQKTKERLDQTIENWKDQQAA